MERRAKDRFNFIFCERPIETTAVELVKHERLEKTKIFVDRFGVERVKGMRDREYSGISAMTDNIRNRRKDREKAEERESMFPCISVKRSFGVRNAFARGQLNAP